MHPAEYYAIGDGNEKLKVYLVSRLRRMKLLQLNDQVFGVRAISIAYLPVTLETTLPIDRLSLVPIPTETPSRIPKHSYTHNNDDRHDNSIFPNHHHRPNPSRRNQEPSVIFHVFPSVTPGACG